MSNRKTPEGEMTLTFCDQDFCDLVAQSLDENLIYTGGFDGKVTISVEDVKAVVKNNRNRWEVLFAINVEDKE